MSDDREPRPVASRREDYRRFVRITTRWRDNDVFGHVNNVVYYDFFDTAVTGLQLEAGLLDPLTSPVICVVVETRCTYFASIAFPQEIEVGLRVERIGRTSVRYRIGIFVAGRETAAAQGDFTHVYVERAGQRPVAIPAPVRALLTSLR